MMEDFPNFQAFSLFCLPSRLSHSEPSSFLPPELVPVSLIQRNRRRFRLTSAVSGGTTVAIMPRVGVSVLVTSLLLDTYFGGLTRRTWHTTQSLCSSLASLSWTILSLSAQTPSSAFRRSFSSCSSSGKDRPYLDFHRRKHAHAHTRRSGLSVQPVTGWFFSR